MDFDGIAQEWASSNSMASPMILSALLGYDPQQLGQLRVSVARHAALAHAVELIDVLAAFHEAKQRLEAAKQASLRVAEIATQLAKGGVGMPELARASVAHAVDAQDAANLALDRAQTGRDKIQAAVVLELADTAAANAMKAAEAADLLATALAGLVEATTHAPEALGGKGRVVRGASNGSGIESAEDATP